MFQSEDIKFQSFDPKDVLGRMIYCADGKRRYVESIVASHQYPTRFLINENIEDDTAGGSWVHVLDLSCQMYGNPRPTPEMIRSFNRAMSAIRWMPDVNVDGQGNIVLPSGVVIPKPR